VLQAGGTIEALELSDVAEKVAAESSPVKLLEQAAACADALEAIEQNGNGGLQIERLLLRVRATRRST